MRGVGQGHAGDAGVEPISGRYVADNAVGAWQFFTDTAAGPACLTSVFVVATAAIGAVVGVIALARGRRSGASAVRLIASVTDEI